MRLHHVGIAVEDLEEAKARYLLLGFRFRVEAEGEVAAQGVRVAMLKGEGEALITTPSFVCYLTPTPGV
jgi:methylmalonyl-CoA/ethylmalonyl-CoA epimerase